MQVDQDTRALLDELEAATAASDLPPPWERPVDDVRDDFMALSKSLAGPGPQVLKVENREIAGPDGRTIPIRIYWPKEADAGEPLPVMAYFHGSGFVVLGLDSHDAACRGLCVESGAIIVAAQYCKAPEHKFPAPVDDAWAALGWVADNCAALGADPARISVGGDSAGANLATVVAQRAKAAGAPALSCQLLVYPVCEMEFAQPSYDTFAEGYNLTRDMMFWFRDLYLRDEADRTNPEAAPASATDLSGLPPAVVVAAECDVLVDEGAAYADRLRAAGVSVDYQLHPGQIHGFWGFHERLPRSAQAHAEAGAALQRIFGTT